jgi:hypothetical protein
VEDSFFLNFHPPQPLNTARKAWFSRGHLEDVWCQRGMGLVPFRCFQFNWFLVRCNSLNWQELKAWLRYNEQSWRLGAWQDADCAKPCGKSP